MCTGSIFGTLLKVHDLYLYKLCKEFVIYLIIKKSEKKSLFETVSALYMAVPLKILLPNAELQYPCILSDGWLQHTYIAFG